MKTMTLNLSDDVSGVVDELAEGSKSDFIRDAIVHFAPLAVLRNRDPIAYFTLMKAAHELAAHVSWTATKLASCEQDALTISEINTKALMDDYTQNARSILDEIKVPKREADRG